MLDNSDIYNYNYYIQRRSILIIMGTAQMRTNLRYHWHNSLFAIGSTTDVSQ